MDVISSMIYETSFRGTVAREVERYIKGTARCWLDKDNDRFVVTIIDPHNKIWSYDEYDLSNKLYSGVTSNQIAHNAIIAYQKKIYREYFK